MRSLILSLTVAVGGCTFADSFDYQFGDGPRSVDLSRQSDGAVVDLPAPVDGAAYDALGPCGIPGLPCCTGGPAGTPVMPCLGGGCCTTSQRCVASGDDVAPSGMASLVCLDGATVACGATGQPCCGAQTCSNGCCVGGTCVADTAACTATTGICAVSTCADISKGNCGGQGDPCCVGAPGTATRNGDYCVASGLACNPLTVRCEACGAANQLCCDGNRCPGGCCNRAAADMPTCLAPGASCGPTEGACGMSGGCAGCGLAGQPCCSDGVNCTAPLTTCLSSMCVSCGGRGQPCCDGNNGGDWCAEPYACDSTKTCQRCGGIGQPCCPGDVCAATTCQAGTC
jgi:hypothetical protein